MFMSDAVMSCGREIFFSFLFVLVQHGMIKSSFIYKCNGENIFNIETHTHTHRDSRIENYCSFYIRADGRQTTNKNCKIIKH